MVAAVYHGMCYGCGKQELTQKIGQDPRSLPFFLVRCHSVDAGGEKPPELGASDSIRALQPSSQFLFEVLSSTFLYFKILMSLQRFTPTSNR